MNYIIGSSLPRKPRNDDKGEQWRERKVLLHFVDSSHRI